MRNVGSSVVHEQNRVTYVQVFFSAANLEKHIGVFFVLQYQCIKFHLTPVYYAFDIY